MISSSDHLISKFLLNKPSIALGSIFLLAFLLRIWGIDFGLPHIYHTDEWFEVKRALKLGAGVFDFDRVGKGGFFYLLFLEYGVYYVILKIAGLVKSGDDFLFRFFQDPTHFWLIGRITTAILGTLNCFFLYLLGKKVYSRTAGLVAALFLAINLLHVRSSHFISVDVPLTCLLTICFFLMAKYFSKPKVRELDYSILGFFAALATMTKIPGAVILLPVLIFHYMNVRSELQAINIKSYILDKRLLYFLLVFTTVYVLGEPGIITKIKSIFFSVVSFGDIAQRAASQPHLGRPESFIGILQYYLNLIFPLRYVVLNIFIWGGIILGFKRKGSVYYLFLSFLIPYLLLLCMPKNILHVFPRYALPLTPILFLWAGISVDALINNFGQKPYGKFIIPALIIITISPIIWDTARMDHDYTKPDTRVLAKKWFEENVSNDSTVIIEGRLYGVISGTVPLKMHSHLVEEIMSSHLHENDGTESKGRFYETLKRSLRTQKTYHLILTGNSEQLLDALNNKKANYVILRERAFTIARHNKHSDLFRLISWVTSGDFELEKIFERTHNTRGSKLLIYKRKRFKDLKYH